MRRKRAATLLPVSPTGSTVFLVLKSYSAYLLVLKAANVRFSALGFPMGLRRRVLRLLYHNAAL